MVVNWWNNEMFEKLGCPIVSYKQIKPVLIVSILIVWVRKLDNFTEP